MPFWYYQIIVYGSGSGTSRDVGYTNYGSLGQYEVIVTGFKLNHKQTFPQICQPMVQRRHQPPQHLSIQVMDPQKIQLRLQPKVQQIPLFLCSIRQLPPHSIQQSNATIFPTALPTLFPTSTPTTWPTASPTFNPTTEFGSAYCSDQICNGDETCDSCWQECPLQESNGEIEPVNLPMAKTASVALWTAQE